MNKEAKKSLAIAIQENDLEKVQAVCDLGPLSTFFAGRSSHWLSYAIENLVDVRVLELLVKGGVDPLVVPSSGVPLFKATRLGRPDYVEFLLNHGTEPHHDVERPILMAVKEKHSAQTQIEMLRQFINCGVDLNYRFTWFDDNDKRFTILDHATNVEVKEFLRAKGAKTAAELAGEGPAEKSTAGVAEVIAYFEQTFGKVEEQPISKVLDIGSQYSVHIIKPNSKNDFFTLFTTGLSAKPMKMPSEHSEESYAELYMLLPADWNIENQSEKWSWPIEHLLELVSYPHANEGFFLPPVTAITNGDPAEALGPDISFTATALVADLHVDRSDGNAVNLYCVMPIHHGECLLAQRDVPAFLKALDAEKVSRVFRPDRPNFA